MTKKKKSKKQNKPSWIERNPYNNSENVSNYQRGESEIHMHWNKQNYGT